MDVVIAPEYRPHPKQKEFHDSGARFACVAAGVGGGKSLSATVEGMRRIWQDYAAGKGKKPAGTGRRRQPRLLYWAVAPTAPLTAYVHRHFVANHPPELIERIYEDAIWLRGEILVEFRSAERPDLLVGAAVDGMILDEACRIRPEAWHGALRGRLTHTGGWAIFASSPAGGRNNWVYKEVVAKSGQHGYAAFQWRTVDNVAVPQIVADAEQARLTQPESWYKREYEANWDSFGGAIYEEFRDELHVTTEERLRFEFGLGRDRPLTTLFNRTIGSIDFGFVAPGCLLIVGEMGDGNWVALDEVYAPGMRPIGGSSRTWLQACQEMQIKWGVREFVGDSAEPESMFDLRNNGISIRAANKSVYMGIRRVASALHPRGGSGRPGLRVMASCKNLIREIRNYQWKPNKEQTGFLEEPADGQEDHAVDSLRYAAMELKLYEYAAGSHGGYSGIGRPIG